MTKSQKIGWEIMVIIWMVYLFFTLLAYCDLKLGTRKDVVRYVGNEVIINKDTLIVTGYIPGEKVFILSNRTTITHSLIKTLPLIKIKNKK